MLVEITCKEEFSSFNASEWVDDEDRKWVGFFIKKNSSEFHGFCVWEDEDRRVS